MRVVEKAGVVGKDYGLPVRLMGVCGEECYFALMGAEDHLLRFGDGGDRT